VSAGPKPRPSPACPFLRKPAGESGFCGLSCAGQSAPPQGSPAVTRGKREHLLPSKPDKADTYGCDAGAVVDHR
jgi:hypothetical protein